MPLRCEHHRVSCSVHRNSASEQVVPRKEQKKDNRQHNADQNNQHVPAHRSLLRDGQSWMTSDGSDTALRGGPQTVTPLPAQAPFCHSGLTLNRWHVPLAHNVLSVAGLLGMKPMDFIERYFGFSPDHGDGRLEALLLLVPLIIITAIAMAFFHKRHVRD